MVNQYKMDRNRVKRIFQLGGSLVSIGLFGWLLSQQDWEQVFSILKEMPIWAIPLSFCLIFSGLVVNAWRWWGLVRSQQIEISFSNTLKIVVAGAYASNFLPSTVGGDVVRIVGMLNYHKSKVVVVSSVVVDRAINVVSYLAFAPLALWVFDIPSLFSTGSHPSLMASSIANVTWGRRLRKLSAKLGNSLRKSFQLWSRSPGVIVKAFLISWLSLLVVFLGVWVLARGIQISVSLIDIIAVSVIVYLLTLLPISVNGYGVREIAVTFLYSQLGASIEQASTLAIITRFISLISTLPGAIWLYRDVIIETVEDSISIE